jgi:predicted ribonuclease toxin of YeeF-YezG toxin-antitoxin module
MKNIRHSIQQFISLEDSLKGKAGKAIREYFEDVKPFIGDKYVFKKNNTFT